MNKFVGDEIIIIGLVNYLTLFLVENNLVNVCFRLIPMYT